MTSADMKQVLCLFDRHKYKSQPRQFVWCGNSAVAAYWPDYKLLQLVAPSAADAKQTISSPDSSQTLKCSTLKYEFNTTQYLCSELDGLRTVSQYLHEFIQPVPYALDELFWIGTSAPSRTLLDAFKLLEDQKHQANNN